VIADLQRNHGFKGAGLTEVILSGGSAGGLAVFYNLDHLSSLLASSSPAVRVTGFPDAGYFLDQPVYGGDDHMYRDNFQGADPVWNVTGSGGTNLACLKANPGADAWKCLMAQYIAPHLTTPIYVMNSMVDAWQVNAQSHPSVPHFSLHPPPFITSTPFLTSLMSDGEYFARPLHHHPK
jgi:hypothetical protein